MNVTSQVLVFEGWLNDNKAGMQNPDWRTAMDDLLHVAEGYRAVTA